MFKSLPLQLSAHKDFNFFMNSFITLIIKKKKKVTAAHGRESQCVVMFFSLMTSDVDYLPAFLGRFPSPLLVWVTLFTFVVGSSHPAAGVFGLLHQHSFPLEHIKYNVLCSFLTIQLPQMYLPVKTTNSNYSECQRCESNLAWLFCCYTASWSASHLKACLGLQHLF